MGVMYHYSVIPVSTYNSMHGGEAIPQPSLMFLASQAWELVGMNSHVTVFLKSEQRLSLPLSLYHPWCWIARVQKPIHFVNHLMPLVLYMYLGLVKEDEAFLTSTDCSFYMYIGTSQTHGIHPWKSRRLIFLKTCLKPRGNRPSVCWGILERQSYLPGFQNYCFRYM